MVKSVGRNPKLTVEEVRKVITLYRENVKPMGNISYSDIHKYANQLHEEGVISANTSDNYWRKEGRIGRTEIDKANEIFSELVSVSKGKEVKIPNMADLVEKKYKNKDDLMKHLLFVEKQFYEALAREKKLENENEKLQESLQTMKDDLKKGQEKNEKLQGLVYRQYRILSEHPNEETMKQTEYAMKTVFSSPAEFTMFETKNELNEEDKVIPFEKDDSKSKFSSRFRKK